MESSKMFGPESVTWRVATDPAMLAAGVRALYLQALHPRAMWGVAQNSDYRQDTWGRLMRTVGFVVTTTFGTVEEAEQAGTRVRKIHSRLRAHDRDTGEEYRIDDPDLLLWVHCAEIDSYLSVTRRSGLHLTDAEADRYVDEQRQVARLVGLDPADVPASVAELAAYFEDVRPVLRATPEARDAASFLLFPTLPVWQTPLRFSFAWLSALSFATLPRWAHRLYRLPAPPGSRATTTATLRTMRNTVGRIPPIWEFPLVKEARSEMAAYSAGPSGLRRGATMVTDMADMAGMTDRGVLRETVPGLARTSGR